MKNEKNRPLWFKLWVDDVLVDYEEALEECETHQERLDIFAEMGKALYDALVYHDSGCIEQEKPKFFVPEAKVLYKHLLRWSRDSVEGYEERAEKNRENGKKGGRPPKSDNVIDLSEAEQSRKEQDEQKVSDFHSMLDRYREERSG